MDISSQHKQWVMDTQKKIEALANRSVLKTYWTEMALSESDNGKNHRFRHPDIPFVQACLIRLEFSDETVGEFVTYLSYDNFALTFRYCNKRLVWPELPLQTEEGDESIFRAVPDITFPSGVISSASTKLDNRGDITEIYLEISGRKLLLKAGEVYECGHKSVIIHEQDESILTFLSADDVRKVRFGEKISINLNEQWLP